MAIPEVDVLLITATKTEQDAAITLQGLEPSHWEPRRDGAGFSYRVHRFDFADVPPLTVALARPSELGETPSAVTTTRLIHELRPRCLAMSGIRAGRRGKVALGDVVVASNVFNYAKGKEKPGTDDLLRETETYNLDKRWKQAAEEFGTDWYRDLVARRPRSLDIQEHWLLQQLYDHAKTGAGDPRSHPRRNDLCPAWTQVVQRLRKRGYMTAKGIRITAKGIQAIEEWLSLYPDGYPDDPAFAVHVAPMASGSVVVKNPKIFDQLESFSRNTLAVEMEANAIGFIAEIERVDKFLIAKGVSDYGDEWKDDAFQPFAARMSAEFVLSFLSKHLDRPNPSSKSSATPNGSMQASEFQEGNGQLAISDNRERPRDTDASKAIPRLCLKQSAIGTGTYQIDLEFEDGLQPRRTASARVEFALRTQDQEDLRWYLEDYLQFPFDPAPTIAARVEARMAEVGVGLFRALFQSGEDTRDLWAKLRDRLNDTRIEIITPVLEAASISWELLRDPKTDVPLALGAKAFVRSHTSSSTAPRMPDLASGPIRILLVICRPGGQNDVPFRSVASQLLKGLGQETRAEFQLDVLRPPTFAHLGRTLRQAKAEGRPYHILHFDGHGLYGEADTISSSGPPNPHVFRRTGKHGYLAFEDSAVENNLDLVDGPSLGKLLVEADVPVLVLNACRSAHADTLDSETPNVPQPTGAEGAAAPVDPHAQVRALGSLAHEVIDAGVCGVVAMRYNVYVVTAAQFVADLYSALVRGQTLGEAVSLGRKQLADQLRRDIGYAPIDLQDWSVPVVYEAAPIALFPKRKIPSSSLTLTQPNSAGQPARDRLAERVPIAPDTGFFGRDETLLALDRAFDRHAVVLLHALAGSGKTSTAADFARWYALTGGIPEGRVLFTTFEHKITLFRVLETLGQEFDQVLKLKGIQWQALPDTKARKNVALQILKQIPVLWIWDNVEPVAGFPSGTVSEWSAEEQQELADFLRAARETKSKFLLTTRRDERGWLGDLPRRVVLPPMPMRERLQLAKALADKQGKHLEEADWRPLLRFTEGNPLTITVLVWVALQKGLKRQEEIAKFVQALRTGTVDFSDDESQGRSKSLGASLVYGLKEAFSEEEQKRLALLAFFQGFVGVDVLRTMGIPPHPLPSLEGVEREVWIRLLDRAAEIGLLTGYGGGYYAVHPALPWFFQSLLTRYYPAEGTAIAGESSEAACRAFVEAIVAWAVSLHNQYNEGNANVIGHLSHEEANIRYARQLAREHGWWAAVIKLMQGLDILCDHLGRNAEWAMLVKEIQPDLVQIHSEGPLPGLEDAWCLLTGYRARLAMYLKDWDEAEHLQRLLLVWSRQQAAHLLGLPTEALDTDQRSTLQTFSVSVSGLGEILLGQGRPECVGLFNEALELSERIGNQRDAGTAAYNLGRAYLEIPSLYDLGQAQSWLQYDLDHMDEHNKLGQSTTLGVMGNIALQQLEEYRAAGRPIEELQEAFNRALTFHRHALDLCPVEAIPVLATHHNSIGVVFAAAGYIDEALRHYQESIRYREQQGNLYEAARTRNNIAILLASLTRFADALRYAQAALRNFQTFGEQASSDIKETQSLIAQIEKDLQRPRP